MVRAACSIVALAVALAVLVTVLRKDDGDVGPHARKYTADEKAAATVALQFANLEHSRDAARA
jgi:hypothetical protein